MDPLPKTQSDSPETQSIEILQQLTFLAHRGVGTEEELQALISDYENYIIFNQDYSAFIWFPRSFVGTSSKNKMRSKATSSFGGQCWAFGVRRSFFYKCTLQN